MSLVSAPFTLWMRDSPEAGIRCQKSSVGFTSYRLSKHLHHGTKHFRCALLIFICAGVLILEFALIRRKPVRSSRALMRYLRMTPQIAALANGIFYTKNIFLVDRILPDRGVSVTFRGPPLTLRYLIRRVETDINIRLRCHWVFLQDLADGSLDFENLRYLRVCMKYREFGRLVFLPVPVTPIRFKCEGEIILKGDWTRHQWSILDQAKDAIQFVS